VVTLLLLSLFTALPATANTNPERREQSNHNGEIAKQPLNETPILPAGAKTVFDVRRKEICSERSLQSAICLPVEHIVADNRRLANFSGLFWVLGTLGLRGTEEVYIIGDSEKRKHFIAGWLYISGQQRIHIVTADMATVLKHVKKSGEKIGKPTHPSTTRLTVFSQAPRTNKILTNSEVLVLLKNKESTTTVLDGRSEAEYWGRRIRAVRGGHLPGAVWLANPNAPPGFTANDIVAYAHDAIDGLALLSQLTLSDIDARLYLGGWADWAHRGYLPADAESFPVTNQQRPIQ